MVRHYISIALAVFAIVSGCRTGTGDFDVRKAERTIAQAMPKALAYSDDFDFAKAERQIAQAIASGQYETADRLIGEEECELAGGLHCDRRNLRSALVKVELGQYAHAKALVDEVLLSFPETTQRDVALALRKWLADKHDSTHNKTPEPSVSPAPQVQR
jgi:hypothetical protein